MPEDWRQEEETTGDGQMACSMDMNLSKQQNELNFSSIKSGKGLQLLIHMIKDLNDFPNS